MTRDEATEIARRIDTTVDGWFTRAKADPVTAEALRVLAAESEYVSGKCDECGAEFETLEGLETHKDAEGH